MEEIASLRAVSVECTAAEEYQSRRKAWWYIVKETPPKASFGRGQQCLIEVFEHAVAVNRMNIPPRQTAIVGGGFDALAAFPGKFDQLAVVVVGVHLKFFRTRQQIHTDVQPKPGFGRSRQCRILTGGAYLFKSCV